VPWLITTAAWPALTAPVAAAMARLLVDPDIAGAMTGAAGAACAAAALVGSRIVLRRRASSG
jgi:hypothetical protein